MKYFPQSLINRTVIVILIGLVIAQVSAMALYSRDRSSVLALSGERHVVDRISMLTRMAEDVSEEARPRMIRKFRGRGMNAENTDQAMVVSQVDSVEQTRMIARDLRTRLGNLPADDVRVRYGKIAALIQFEGMEDGIGGIQRLFVDPREDFVPLLASVRLRDGSWLNISVPISRDGPVWRAGFFIPVILANVLIISLIVFSINKLAAPLRLFAHAAERLGANVDAPALQARGPLEVRRAIKAFNEMQHRLQEVVHGRTQMLASISHDLRTPMTRLRLRAEFIEDAEIQRKVLADISEIELMVKSTLDFARDDAKVEAVCRLDLSAMLASLCDESADAGSNVVFNGKQKVLTAGRPIALKRAFRNLIDNAVNYAGGGQVSVHETATTVVVFVEDNGPGIPRDQQEAVFRPFYRLETSRSRATGGVGLGLSVVRDIMVTHNGTIKLNNRAAGGLAVRLEFPKG